MADIKWEKIDPAWQEYENGYRASFGGIMAVVHSNDAKPDRWRLTCRDLGIVNWVLKDTLEKSKADAVSVISLQIREKIKRYKGILSKIK